MHIIIQRFACAKGVAMKGLRFFAACAWLSTACACLISSGADLAVAPSLTVVPQAPPDLLIDKRVRNEVLNSLAQALESQYVLPDMAKTLAAAVRAKQKARA